MNNKFDYKLTKTNSSKFRVKNLFIYRTIIGNLTVSIFITELYHHTLNDAVYQTLFDYLHQIEVFVFVELSKNLHQNKT